VSRVIRIRFDPIAGPGNNMFHYLLANVMQDYVPSAVIVGDRLPEWVAPHGSDEKSGAKQSRNHRAVRSCHSFPQAIERLRSSDNIEICTRSLALRMEYFSRHLNLARRVFPARVLPSPGLATITSSSRSGAVKSIGGRIQTTRCSRSVFIRRRQKNGPQGGVCRPNRGQ
jgi:hypothetical protein